MLHRTPGEGSELTCRPGCQRQLVSCMKLLRTICARQNSVTANHACAPGGGYLLTRSQWESARCSLQNRGTLPSLRPVAPATSSPFVQSPHLAFRTAPSASPAATTPLHARSPMHTAITFRRSPARRTPRPRICPPINAHRWPPNPPHHHAQAAQRLAQPALARPQASHMLGLAHISASHSDAAHLRLRRSTCPGSACTAQLSRGLWGGGRARLGGDRGRERGRGEKGREKCGERRSEG